MKYKVTSKIDNLEQNVRGTTIIHSQDYPRTVEWFKENEEDGFFSSEEANSLKEYLDTKRNFSENVIVEISTDEEELSIIDGGLFTKNIEKGRISLDKPIQISECDIFRDYDLDFNIEGHLNINDLT